MVSHQGKTLNGEQVRNANPVLCELFLRTSKEILDGSGVDETAVIKIEGALKMLDNHNTLEKEFDPVKQ